MNETPTGLAALFANDAIFYFLIAIVVLLAVLLFWRLCRRPKAKLSPPPQPAKPKKSEHIVSEVLGDLNDTAKFESIKETPGEEAAPKPPKSVVSEPPLAKEAAEEETPSIVQSPRAVEKEYGSNDTVEVLRRISSEAPQKTPPQEPVRRPTTPIVAPAPAPEVEPEPPAPEAKAKSLEEGLAKTKGGFIGKLNRLLFGSRKIDESVFEELEEILYEADIGPTATKLFTNVCEQAKRKDLRDAAKLKELLREEIRQILARAEQPLVIPEHKPFAILMVGVNGVGKTTTIGKLAHQWSREGKSVLLAAGDTFRAAAVEQLSIWGDRSGVEVISADEGSNPSGIIFTGAAQAKARGMDIFIADTAGRLHTKFNLMEELRKMKKVAAKALEREPDEVWLVIDANTGQNAVNQAAKFHEDLGLTGLILTKLDGTAKGGVVIGITDQLGLPIRYIGIGEGIDDLRPFNARDFVDALF